MSENPIIPGQRYTLFGEELRPYSASRKVAANAMGMIFPAIGEEGAKRFEAGKPYDGFLKDAILCLWLCSIPDARDLTKDEMRAGQWTPQRAIDQPEAAKESAFEWADGKGIADMASEQFVEAGQVALAILLKVEAAKFTLQVPDAPPGPPEDDEGKV